MTERDFSLITVAAMLSLHGIAIVMIMNSKVPRTSTMRRCGTVAPPNLTAMFAGSDTSDSRRDEVRYPFRKVIDSRGPIH